VRVLAKRRYETRIIPAPFPQCTSVRFSQKSLAEVRAVVEEELALWRKEIKSKSGVAKQKENFESFLASNVRVQLPVTSLCIEFHGKPSLCAVQMAGSGTTASAGAGTQSDRRCRICRKNHPRQALFVIVW
jgi:hypothetical protein